jgi:hypothetical protein
MTGAVARHGHVQACGGNQATAGANFELPWSPIPLAYERKLEPHTNEAPVTLNHLPATYEKGRERGEGSVWRRGRRQRGSLVL